MKIRPVGAELFRVDGRTEASSRFRSFATASNNSNSPANPLILHTAPPPPQLRCASHHGTSLSVHPVAVSQRPLLSATVSDCLQIGAQQKLASALEREDDRSAASFADVMPITQLG